VISPNQLYVTPGYLEAMKVRLKSGRFFNASDTADAPKTVVVDENLARKFWPNQDPVGKRAYLPDSPEDVARPGPKVTWMTVVGVVGEVKMKGLVEAGETARAGAFYAVMDQHESRGLGLAIRTKGDLGAMQAAVTRALSDIDPDVPMTDVFTMSARIDKSLNPRRAPMLLSLGFGVVAVLLASVGLYGVLAYHVSQRTREIGIRMALGSDAGGIVRLVLGEGGTLVLVGLAAGLVGAVALRGAVASQLYGVGALDPLVMAGAIGVLGATSLIACWGPARRAAKVSPLVALSRQ
jgi:predicted permease